MKPSPEMEAFAREVASKHFGTSGNGLMIRLMSVAIMEAGNKAAEHLKPFYPYSAEVIRSGEYLNPERNPDD